MSTTTIRIDTETRDRLRALGRMGESYDDVIRQLLQSATPEAKRSAEHGRRSPLVVATPLFGRQDRI
jgi:hypothetical protein